MNSRDNLTKVFELLKNVSNTMVNNEEGNSDFSEFKFKKELLGEILTKANSIKEFYDSISSKYNLISLKNEVLINSDFKLLKLFLDKVVIVSAELITEDKGDGLWINGVSLFDTKNERYDFIYDTGDNFTTIYDITIANKLFLNYDDGEELISFLLNEYEDDIDTTKYLENISSEEYEKTLELLFLHMKKGK